MILSILGLAAPAWAAPRTAPTALAPIGESPIGAHSMLYLSTPYSAMTDMFRQASDMGASDIRLNIELSTVFPGRPPRDRRGALRRLPGPSDPIQWALEHRPGQGPLAHGHWSGVDEYMRLARTYHLHVLAVLTSTPAWMADCPHGTPSGEREDCPPSEARWWGQAAGEIAAHTRGVIDDYEIMNEPDGHWSFAGSPHQYANLLAASYDAIHTVNPTARVLLGGLMHLGSRGISWMDAMLATPGAHAAHKFDVANIHVRLPPLEVAPAVCRWRSFFARSGFQGPLWVTETGYPANAAHQDDPGYENGPRAQARWLGTEIPTLLASGVERVFVTERDLSRGGFASEGVLRTPNPLPPRPAITRRPSFYAVQGLARGGWVQARLHYAQRDSGSC